MWEDPAGEEVVGTCQVCGCEIRAAVERQARSASLIRAVRQATEQHLQSHTPAERALAELRLVLPHLSAAQRRVLVKDIYTELLQDCGEVDRPGVYSIDEALGSMALYRLWRTANSCCDRGCRHLA